MLYLSLKILWKLLCRAQQMYWNSPMEATPVSAPVPWMYDCISTYLHILVVITSSKQLPWDRTPATIPTQTLILWDRVDLPRVTLTTSPQIQMGYSYRNLGWTKKARHIMLRRYGSNSKIAMFKYMLQIKFVNTSYDTALRWMLQNTSDDTMKLHGRYGVYFKALEKSYCVILRLQCIHRHPNITSNGQTLGVIPELKLSSVLSTFVIVL